MGNTWNEAKRTTGFMDQLDLEVSLGRGLTKQNEQKAGYIAGPEAQCCQLLRATPYFNEEIGTVFALQQLLADRGF